MTAIRLRPWMSVPVAGLAAVAIAALGTSFTDLGPWYQGLEKPAWQPPGYLFGPAWTLIYALAALAAAAAWRDAPDRASRDWLIGLFALNGALNILWSLLFFRLQRPDWALLEVVFLWASIALIMLVLGRYSRRACWLLAPYLAWVTFAAALNLAVVRLNAPF